MNIKPLITSISLGVYSYTPEESVVIKGIEYIVKGTGQSQRVPLATFKKAGTRIPDTLCDVLTEEHVQELKDRLADEQQARAEAWFRKGLQALLPALQRASAALGHFGSEDAQERAAGNGGPARPDLSSQDLARLYVLMEQFKRNLSSAGLATPTADAKEQARTWLDEQALEAPEEDYREGGDFGLAFGAEGLALYAEKNDVKVPEAILNQAAASDASRNDENEETDDEDEPAAGVKPPVSEASAAS